MIEVTNKNFDGVLNEFRHEISKCSFYSLDCEFSSLPLDTNDIRQVINKTKLISTVRVIQ